MQAALMLQDRGAQDRFLSMVSPDMTAMLNVGWNYMYGQELRDMPMNAMGHLDMPLSAHPVMGMGAYDEGYQIRTLEDMGLDVRDAGLGWKSQMIRMNGSLVQQESVSSLMSGLSTVQPDFSTSDIQATITAALAQMGLVVDVTVRSTGGPSEIHLQQSL